MLGKAGRAETSTDPAPLSMIETVVILKPTSEWRKTETWYSGWAPEWAKGDLPPHHTRSHIAAGARLRDERRPAPARARQLLDHADQGTDRHALARACARRSGSRSPGPTSTRSRRSAAGSNIYFPRSTGTRSVFAERTAGGYFYDVEWNRDELARYGVSMEEAQAAVERAIGGDNVTFTVEGRERYPVNVRYMRDFRSDVPRSAGS